MTYLKGRCNVGVAFSLSKGENCFSKDLHAGSEKDKVSFLLKAVSVDERSCQ